MNIGLIVNTIAPIAILAFYYTLWSRQKTERKYFITYSLLALLVIAVWWLNSIVHTLFPIPSTSLQVSDKILWTISGLALTALIIIACRQIRRVNTQKKLNWFSDEELLNEFKYTAQNNVFFFKSDVINKRNESTEAYARMLDIQREISRRDPTRSILTPLLRDQDDAIRVWAAAFVAKPGDDMCLRILRDVADRPEMNPANVVLVARFFVQSIYRQELLQTEI